MTRANLHRMGLLLAIVWFALSGCQSPMRTEAASVDTGAPLPGGISTPSGPRFNPGGPDADEYGARLGYPVTAVNRPGSGWVSSAIKTSSWKDV